MTFNSLIQAVQDELERYDTLFVSYIPTFINDAIDQINVDARNIGLEQYIVGFFEPSNPVIAKPDRWRRTITLNYGTSTNFNTIVPIQQMTYEFLNAYWPDPTQTGAPLYYSDYGFYNIKVAPTPDLAYPFQLAYMELPSPLGEQVQQNWLTNYAPKLLKYGTLLQAVIWLKDPEQIPIMEDQYQKYLTPFNGQNQLRHIDRQNNREAD